MLERILNLRTMEELVAISIELMSERSRSTLFMEIAGSGLVLSIGDLWTREQIAAGKDNPNWVSKKFELSLSEKSTVKLVHRMQLLTVCNVVIADAICNYLDKAAV